jgi:hypothetical protein
MMSFIKGCYQEIILVFLLPNFKKHWHVITLIFLFSKFTKRSRSNNTGYHLVIEDRCHLSNEQYVIIDTNYYCIRSEIFIVVDFFLPTLTIRLIEKLLQIYKMVSQT